MLVGGEWSSLRNGRYTSCRKKPRYSLGRRLGGPQNHSIHVGEEINSQPPPGIEPAGIEVNAERTKYMVMSHHQNVGQKS
jgi:hypothetical protein